MAPDGAQTPSEVLTTRRSSLLMATQDSVWSRPNDPAPHNLQTERAALAFLLDQHPSLLTRNELIGALDPKGLAEKDAIARAIRELIGAGLLRDSCGSLTPTRAALYFAALEAD